MADTITIPTPPRPGPDLFEALTRLHLVLTMPWAYTVVGIDLTAVMESVTEAIDNAAPETAEHVLDLMEGMASHRDGGPCDEDCPARLEVVLYPDEPSDIRICGRVVQGRVEPRCWWPVPA